ncbi:kinase-interacting protein 1-like [Salvia miltiorrhiza]|uniref:kinase-interacting protein 1-like n=1 Tax=Salvia miltiorrhiza TaxID=226208 RepID=UPI0025ACE196|nr:kinase-interacting protein 1-like [Salvia miltiorrhiza]
MLQRAASNACSWWWASHIRTKQSKWLEQSMQDMEEKVHSMLKLIEEEGDSFAKRAEMYYKRRPELIEAVEDSYRAFKALADRYDMLSKELQNANNTIATVFPEQVQLAMEAEDECPTPTPKPLKNVPAKSTNVPKVPKASMDTLKGFLNNASKQFQPKKTFSKTSSKSKQPRPKPLPRSGMSKEEALLEIDKVNKEILALQTVKEFCKSSYENGLAKFYEIDNQIMEMQDKVSKLQDEYEVEAVIEDGEARTLMAEAALKSCKDTLATLQEKQDNSTKDAQDEFKKIEEARHHLHSLKQDCGVQHLAHEEDEPSKPKDEEDITSGFIQELNDMETLTSDKTMDLNSSVALTVTQLAEKIDVLVNKVVNLETAVSSQTVLINTMRTESDELRAQIKKLEGDKEKLMGDTRSLSMRIKELEDKLSRLEELNNNVEAHNNKLEANFAHCRCSLDHLSEKLTTVRPDDEAEESDSSHSMHAKSKKKKEKKEKKEKKDKEKKEKKEKKDKTTDEKEVPPISGEEEAGEQEEVKDQKEELPSPRDIKVVAEDKKQEDAGGEDGGKENLEVEQQASVAKQYEVYKPVRRSVTFAGELTKARADEDAKAQEAKESELSWQQMLLNGAEDRDKILLREYTTILRNYKDVKRKLSDTEKKDRDIQFDITMQMRELKQAIMKRDQEIQHLRQELSLLQGNKDGAKKEAPSNSSSAEPESADEEAAGKVESAEQSGKPESGTEDSEVEEKEDDIKLMFKVKASAVSAVEERLRMEIDAILDENLDFWLRFSTAFHQVQKFKSEAQDLLEEIAKLREKKKQEGCMTAQLKSEVRPIYKHLREIQTELTMWLEQRVCLKDELKGRFTSLCSIQEEITTALKEGVEEEEIRFSSHQAAKLQGEILSMKQENNKVREELQTCLDHVSVLQLDIEKTLRQLNQEFSICTDQPQLQHAISRSKIPLRSFIFGTKVKKQKSLFNFMHANRKMHGVRALPPL